MQRYIRVYPPTYVGHKSNRPGNGVNLDPFDAKHPYVGSRTGNAYILTNSDPDIETGTFLNLVTGQREVRGYRSLIPKLYTPDNCTTISVEDSVEGIWDAASEMVHRILEGDSVAIDLSNLRPEGSPVKGSGGTSSGPASFAVEVFDNFATWAYLGGADYAGPVATLRYLYAPTLRVIRQGGVRRGAGMATLSATHPDLEDFLTAKTLERERVEGDISTFNISVLASDVFMVMPEWQPQRDLIAQQAWTTGEPGLLFVDTINRHNLMFEVDGPITATNPCFSGDTLIETEFGPTPIKDIKEPTWVYTMDRHGKLDIALATAAWMTREKAETLTLRFNNGRELTVTPDHLIYVEESKNTEAGWVMAQNLVEGDAVVGFCRARRGAKYSGVKLSSEDNRAYRMEHRFVYEGLYGPIPEGYDVHHIDGDTYNNSLDNLELLTHSEHAVLTRYSVPNDHMVNCPNTGRFISTEASKRGAKTIVPVPDHLASKWPGTPRIVSIVKGPEIPVYDISVPGYGNVIANGIVAHNCGEIGLYPGEPCDLGAMNIAAYVDEEGFFDWDGFEQDVSASIEYLDRVLSVTVAPLPEIREAIDDKRRIGLGMMGLGDAFIKMGIPFDHDHAVSFANSLAGVMAEVALDYTLVSEEYASTGPRRAGHDRHNVALLTVAPTGTTAMLFGVTSGIEPLFAPFIYRRVGTEYKQILHPLFKDVMERHAATPYFCTWEPHPEMEGAFRPGKWDWAKVTEAISKNHGSVQGITGIPEQVQKLFRCAHDIAPEDHIEIQGAVQRGFDYAGRIPSSINKSYVGNSISKTINFGNKVNPEDILQAMALAWRIGCKGVTVYRDGSRDLQVLNTSLQEDDGSDAASQQADQLDEIVAASCSLDGTCDV